MPAVWDNSGTTGKVLFSVLLSDDGSPATPGLAQITMFQVQVNLHRCEGGWGSSSLKSGLGHLASPRIAASSHGYWPL